MHILKISSDAILKQGSIFDLNNLRLKKRNGESGKYVSFRKCYPQISLDKTKYGIIITQTCDLEHGKNASLTYLTVAFLEPIEKYLPELLSITSLDKLHFNLKINEDSYQIVNKTKILGVIEESLGKLFQNNVTWGMFILLEPHEEGLFVVNLTKTVPLRRDHEKVLVSRIKYELTTEFQAKMAWKYASLFGRIGTPDFSKEKIDQLTEEILKWVGKTKITDQKAQFLSDEKFKILQQVKDAKVEKKKVAFAEVFKAQED